MGYTKIIAAILFLALTGSRAGAAEDAPRRRYQLLNSDGKPEGKPALDLAGTRIVFYGEPGAAFSIQAMEDLSKDDTAKTALLARGFFITKAESLEAAAEWNKASPYEYAVIYAGADWPELALTAEPRIFFYKDGTALCDLKGWRGAESAAGFKACLEKSGLLAVPARVGSALAVRRLARGEDSWDEERKRLAGSEFKTLLGQNAFAPGELAAFDDRTLKDAYALASHFNFYTPSSKSLAAQEEILAALGKRGLANEEKVQDLHNYLLDSKLFTKASALKELYPSFELQSVPPITGSLAVKPGEAAVFYTKDGVASLEIRKVKKNGRRILVAARPDCHFAHDALTAIEKDPELRAVFSKYALTLTPQMDFGALGSWNKAHRLKYLVANSASDWPGVDFSLSPSFYFIRNGKILHTVPGWADEDPFDDIYAGLAKLFPEMKFKQLPKRQKAGTGKPEARRRLPRYPLGKYLKGLNETQLNRFCSSLRFDKGAFAGADMADVREIFGEKRVEDLSVFFTGGPAPRGASPGGVTLGRLWKGLDQEQLNRTCSTMLFSGGSFGGLNFGDLTDVFGEKAVEETFAFFTPPPKK